MVHCVPDMGQHSSLPKGRKKSMKSSTISRKAFSTNANGLSHTFALNEDSINERTVELVNINTASEEELMTLDGVTREIAKNVVEHRKAIGRFRKVEDLAVVRGIGADKLQLLRPEICVSSRRVFPSSRSASRAPSYDSLRSNDSKSTVRFVGPIDINRATVFDLQNVHGITQEIAAAIVHYRDKKGKFKQVEDLSKVKGMDKVRLHNVAIYLTVDSMENIPEINGDVKQNILTNGYTMPVPKESKLHHSIQRKIPIANGLSHSSEADIFELLSAYSPRPVVPNFDYSYNGECAIRMACWNLHEFSYEKATNLGVKEVICRTILENGLSVLALQGIANVTALKVICEEMNNPTLQRVKEWKDRQHNWNFCMLDTHDSKLGYIYDSDGAFDIELISLKSGPEDTRKECEVLVANFRINNIHLDLVNLMLNDSTNLDTINRKLAEFCSEDEFLMVFIDFTNARDVILPLGNLKSVFTPNTKTYFFYSSLGKTSPHASNILYNSKVNKQITGSSGIIRQGLTHLAIPNGWTWGGPVSPYCPVWTELYVDCPPTSSTTL